MVHQHPLVLFFYWLRKYSTVTNSVEETPTTLAVNPNVLIELFELRIMTDIGCNTLFVRTFLLLTPKKRTWKNISRVSSFLSFRRPHDYLDDDCVVHPFSRVQCHRNLCLWTHKGPTVISTSLSSLLQRRSSFFCPSYSWVSSFC